MEGAYFTYMVLYGINFLNNLGIGALHVASASQRGTMAHVKVQAESDIVYVQW